MTKMEEFKKELEKMMNMEDNKIETIDCRISEEIPVKPAAFVPLMWKEILRDQPEKAEILRNWFFETGNWPTATSTPVFDVTTQTIYPAYSLDYRWGSYCEGGGAVAQKIKKAVREGTPVKWEWAYYDKTEEAMKRFRNHYFVGASDVDEVILVAALERYKKMEEEKAKQEEKNKALDEVLTKLKALEEEIKEIQKK